MTEKTMAERIAEELLKERLPDTIKVSTPGQPTVKKEAKVAKSPLIKAKLYYDVKVECMLPATVTFRILAEDAEQAAGLIRGASPIAVKHRLLGRKDHKITVCEAGSSMIKWVKNLIGM